MVPTEANYESLFIKDQQDRAKRDSCIITLGILNKTAFMELILPMKHKQKIEGLHFNLFTFVRHRSFLKEITRWQGID